MTTRLFIVVVVLALPALSPCAGQVEVESGLCASPEFRAAFLADQGDVPFDYLDISPELTAYGDAALPCLITIAQDDGVEYGISGCVGQEDGCAVWAVRAIKEIGTPKALEALRKLLAQEHIRPKPLVVVLNSLRTTRVRDTRADVLGLLNHVAPQVRAEALVTLGWIGNRADFEVMLDTTLDLPDKVLYRGAYGLEQLRDPRAIDPLAERVDSMPRSTEREQLHRRIEKMRSEVGDSPCDEPGA